MMTYGTILKLMFALSKHDLLFLSSLDLLFGVVRHQQTSEYIPFILRMSYIFKF